MKSGNWRWFSKWVIPYLFLAPALTMMGIFIFYPIVNVLALSTTDYNLAFQNNYVGFRNFEKLLTLDFRELPEGQSLRSVIPAGHGELGRLRISNSTYVLSAREPDFWKALRNSFYYLVATPIIVMLSIIVAVIVNQPLRAIGFFRAGYYIPAITSVVAVGLMWRTLYQQDGVLNQFLLLLGLDRIGWLTRPEWVLPSVIIVTIWRGVGFYMVIFLAGLQSIPFELYEAAAIDGANRWQQHYYITIPGLRPSIAFVSVVSAISALRAFDEAYVIAGKQGGVLGSALTSVLYIYQRFDVREIGYASAISVIFFVITLVFSLINLRLLENRNV